MIRGSIPDAMFEFVAVSNGCESFLPGERSLNEPSFYKLVGYVSSVVPPTPRPSSFLEASD